jgi:arsenate reductase
MIIEQAQPYRQEIISLLESQKLPVNDLPDDLNDFLVAIQNQKVVGVAGLEVYGNFGLLRSLAVHPEFRNAGIAQQLLQRIAEESRSKGLVTLYLLTETASAYFDRKGFLRISRDEVPPEVQQSSEFSHICPVSAIVMKKTLKNTHMKNILVLCTGNSCRSQIAEGYLRHFAGDKAKIYSAGIETHGVNPRAIEIMKRDGIDISHHTSNNVNEYLDIDFDYVITVCDNAKESCPYFPTKAVKLHYNFPDPAKAIGTEEEIIEQFRQVREMIRQYTQNFVNENLKQSHAG